MTKPTKNTGLCTFILTHLRKSNALPMVSLTEVTEACKAQFPTTTRKDVAGMMAYLARDPETGIALTHRRGWYAWHGIAAAAPKQDDPAKVAIDNLLDAMAKAEPVLRRWAKFQAALDSLNEK